MSKAQLKSKTTIGEALASEVKETAKNKSVLSIVNKCLAAGKTMIQSVNEFEKMVQNAAEKALEHAEAHGDVMPMHRLVMGLREFNHPSTTRLSQEVIAWVRSVSPIVWDSKGNPRQLKEGDDGFKDYDVLKAVEVPFFETPMATRARTAMADAHSRSLKPVTLKDVLNRAKGIIKFIDGANQPDKNGDKRGIAKGEGVKIKTFAGKFQQFLVENGMEEEESKAA